METMEQVVKKAQTSSDFLTGDNFSIGGSDVERWDAYISNLQNGASPMLSLARVVSQTEKRIQIEKIGFDEDSYTMQNIEEGEDITNESDATFTYQYIMTKEFGGFIMITDQMMEDYRNQGGNLAAKIIQERLMPKHQREISKLIYLGDTSSSHKTLKAFDGIQKLADSCQVIDAAEAYFDEGLADQAMQALPSKYFTPNVTFFMNKKMFQNFQTNIRDNRATALGDLYYLGQDNPIYNGMNIKQDIYIPEYTGTNLCTDIYLVDPANIIIGFQRGITFEKVRSASKRADLYYYTLRMGMAIEDTNALVKVKNVRIQAYS